MSYRGHYEGRDRQAPGMMRHTGTNSSGHRSSAKHSLELAEKISAQEAEIKRLDGDNRKLASMQVVLREELASAQRELHGVEAHIRSIQTESDLQIRILLDKIAKMELDIRSGLIIRMDLQQAHAEAQSSVAAIQDISTKILIATRELEKTNLDIKVLSETLAECESLMQEQQMLRVAFEHEKDVNVKEVKEMEDMEKDLVKMVREAEKLRLELIKAEQQTRGPHDVGHPYSSQPEQATQLYMAECGNVHLQTGEGIAGDNMVPIGSNVGGGAPGGTVGAQTIWQTT